MTETMFDRVTRSVGEAMYGYCDPSNTPNTWPLAAEVVRAVLQAIREPDLFVCLTGQTFAQTSTAIGHKREGEVFTAMIDSILSQSQEGKHP